MLLTRSAMESAIILGGECFGSSHMQNCLTKSFMSASVAPEKSENRVFCTNISPFFIVLAALLITTHFDNHVGFLFLQGVAKTETLEIHLTF